jgi:hypothetical protein
MRTVACESLGTSKDSEYERETMMRNSEVLPGHFRVRRRRLEDSEVPARLHEKRDETISYMYATTIHPT